METKTALVNKPNSFINNSLINHVLYKFWIWRRKYPHLFQNYLKINQEYTLMKKAAGNILVLIQLFNYRQVLDYFRNNLQLEHLS